MDTRRIAKSSRGQPDCDIHEGNSRTAPVWILSEGAQVVSMVAQELGIESFACVNVLSDPRARPSLKDWSDFPTIPQIFINGELIGGSDIAIEMYQSGELSEMVASKDTSE